MIRRREQPNRLEVGKAQRFETKGAEKERVADFPVAPWRPGRRVWFSLEFRDLRSRLRECIHSGRVALPVLRNDARTSRGNQRLSSGRSILIRSAEADLRSRAEEVA